MKRLCYIIVPILILLFSQVKGFSQYNWKLSKDKDGIKVFLSETPQSKFKSIRVECTLKGNYEKLIHALSDVDHFKDWVYRTKTARLLKKPSADELYYYSETSLPWPLSNRDVVAHVRIQRNGIPGSLKIITINESGYVADMSGKERVPHLKIEWNVTMPDPGNVHIIYTIEINPGGSLPAWMANMFADKGPFETFKKLEVILKK